ncbi:von Willebrand factor type A domain-containing protein, partial [Streptomyces sp. NPDC059755]|uniref:VWA domain-containing protein n=1 Tax=Streptomyces sp. NPDC059755 TaxID=3346934 RepID=UPI003653A9BE
MKAHRTHRIPRLFATAAATALLLTGCGADGSDADRASDGAARGSEAFPAPNAPRGDTDGNTDRNADKEADEDGRTAAPDHLSTFALDVDTASYGYTRRTLTEGRRPDPSTIRPEEFVNSFRQDYERPDGNGFSVTVEGGPPPPPPPPPGHGGVGPPPPPPDGARPPPAPT